LLRVAEQQNVVVHGIGVDARQCWCQEVDLIEPATPQQVPAATATLTALPWEELELRLTLLLWQSRNIYWCC
jgi:hypothetical protein